MQRFHLPKFNFTNQVHINKDTQPSLWHQLKNVLRSEAGDQLMLFGNDNYQYEYRIEAIEKGSFSLVLVNKILASTELPFQLILIQALPQKAEKWEWLLQKGTELGVSTFVPLITERTQRKNLPKGDRMERIMVEAVEQSGRVHIPTITEVQSLKDLDLSATKTYFASLKATKSLLQLSIDDPSSISIIVGPEGGFTPFEEEVLLAKGAVPYSLGDRVLRLETAAIISLGILSSR